VLTAVFDLSLSFGCDPLVFVGADLAYTDERPYCRGTAFERDWARHAANGVSLRQVWHNTVTARAAVVEADVHGQRTHTAAHLIEFRNWLVTHAGKHPDRRVLNATGAGILHGSGIEQTELTAALGDFPDRGDAIRDTIHRLFGRRRVSVQQRPVVEALTVIEKATSVDHTVETTSPVAEWLTFGKPSLTADDIHAAATQGRTDLERAWPGRTMRPRSTDAFEAPTLRLHDADRVARMRALLTEDRTVLDGCTAQDRSRANRPRQAAAWDMAHILTALLSMPRLTDDLGDAFANSDNADVVPLSCRFAWTPSASCWIAALEELLLDDSELSRPASVAKAANDDFWSGWIAPVVDASSLVSDEPATGDDLARVELTSLRLRLFDDEYSASSPRQQRLTQALLRGASVPSLRLPASAPYRLELVARGGATSVPVRIDALMRALTGTLARAGARRTATAPADETVWVHLRSVVTTNAEADPRLTFLATDVDYVEPGVLTNDGLPRGYSLFASSPDRVVFVPAGSTESRLITSDGDVEAGSRWPVPITGEVPWGTDGGALAWNSTNSTILLRPHTGAEILVDSVPFQPIRVVLGPDGSAYWSASKGGVWTWLPGQSGHLLLDTPTWGGLFLDGDDLVLPPIARDDQGLALRQRLNYEWRCALTSPTLRQVSGAPEGQCLGVTQRGRWTARAYPYSDLIRLDSTDGDALVLACFAPTSVAWAGDSLVVGTGEGVVLVFRALIDRLTSLCPQASTD
jgi:hypothetical protein